MWFIGVEVEQETSAPPPKKILDPPLRDVAFPSLYVCNFIPQNLVVQHWSMLVPVVFLLLMVV